MITLLDGAMGTSLWPKVTDKQPVWRYNLENPDAVKSVHREMVDAGAQIILSNTFGANGPEVKRSPYTVEKAVRSGMEIARDAAGTSAKVFLDFGPLTGLLEPYGDIEEEEAEAFYTEMLHFGMLEHPDGILLETFIDLNMLCIAAKCARKYDVPLFCSMSFEKVGRTMMGNSVQDMIETLSPLHPDAIGLNCSMGPELCLPVLRTFRDNTDLPLLFKPNAGLPEMVDGQVVSPYTPDMFARDMLPALKLPVAYAGGCCGTTCQHIRKLAEAVPSL